MRPALATDRRSYRLVFFGFSFLGLGPKTDHGAVLDDLLEGAFRPLLFKKGEGIAARRELARR